MFRKQHGLSLVENLVVLAIVGILLAVAMPSLRGLVDGRRLQGAAETFRTDFQQARMLALGSGRSVRIGFEKQEAGSCYVVYQGDKEACSCGADGVPVCKAGGRLLSHQWLASSAGLAVEASVKQLTIEAGLGMVTPTATVRLQGSGGSRLAHVVAVTGRVRSCGSTGSGHPACA